MNKISRLGRKSFLLVAIAVTTLLTMPSHAAKELVLVAGTRQEGIRDFFYEHSADFETKEGLQEWTWPTLHDEDYKLVKRESATWTKVWRQNVFGLLFEEETNSIIQQTLMEAIRESWDNSSKGIILGEEKFANVGVQSLVGSDDALKVIYRLMENLSITPKDVTLVLIYYAPRVEQWASIWHDESTYQSYANFVCKLDEDDERSEFLDTTMNPFRLSKVYREHGWKVVVVDEAGVRKSGLDPAHAVACDILGVSCKKGWVAGLENEASKDASSYDVPELNENEKEELEALFLLRDCVYKHDLEQEKEFEVLHQKVVWKDCRNHFASDLREKMKDVDYVLSAIQSQMGCGDESVNLSEILASANSSSFRKRIWAAMCFSIFFLAIILRILYIQHQKNSANNHDGIFRNFSLRRKKPKRSAGGSKSLCNACKFVRVDPNCIFCGDGTHKSSSAMGKEVERRIKQQRDAVILGTTVEIKDRKEEQAQLPKLAAPYSDNTSAAGLNSLVTTSKTDNFQLDTNNSSQPNVESSQKLSGGGIDTSHFDINLRNTSKRRKMKTKKKDKEGEKKKKVVSTMSLLVVKVVDGKKVYSIAEPSDISSAENLQSMGFEEDDKVYV